MTAKVTHEEIGSHNCRREESWDEYDARGIYLCRVCEACCEAKLSTYRWDVLNNPSYTSIEPIDDWE